MTVSGNQAPSITTSSSTLMDAVLFILCNAVTIHLAYSYTAGNVAYHPQHPCHSHAAVSRPFVSSHVCFSTGTGRQSKQDNARAGTQGYSLIRQPVSWNPGEDPTFDVPRSLREGDDQGGMLEDSLWWSGTAKLLKSQEWGTENRAGRSNQMNRERQQPTSQAMAGDEDLNLYQRSYDTLDFPKVLRSLYQECSTTPARKIVHLATRANQQPTSHGNMQVPKTFQHNYMPLLAESAEGVQERYRAVQEMDWLLSGGNGDDIRLNNNDYSYRNRKNYKESIVGRPPPLQGLSFNLDAVLQIADDGKVLEGPEILEVSEIMDALENVMLWCQALEKVEELPFVELPKIASGISLNTTLQDLLSKAFDEKGMLSGKTFPVIGSLRERVRTLKADVLATLESILAMPSIQAKLALESGGSLYSEVNGGRLVIPIASKYATSVGIVHDTSRSEKTVYVEPTEIVGPTNELRQLESELRQEESRVWRSLTDQILKNRVELEASVSAIGQLDLVNARLMLGRKLEGTIPLVEDEGVISLRDAKHPVLLLREVDNVVGSDVDLGADGNQGLVLTGPNAGGKTVILKLLGLMALMSRCGIPVPAAAEGVSSSAATANGEEERYQPRIDFFDPVLADIGDLQSVGGDLSTFSGHMLVCREVLSNSGENALVLMDELGSGTDPNQGVAIAQAIMEALVEAGARVAITTHYLQLKQLAASDDRFAVAGMQFINGKPTYRLQQGTVGESYALAVAQRLALPSKVISRANELLDSDTRTMGELIRELEDQRALVDQQMQELQERQKAMKELELQIKEEKIRLEKKQLTARREEANKFAKKLEEKEAVIAEVLERLKQDPSRRVLAKSWDDIKFVRRDALNEAENVPSVLARKEKIANAVEEVRAELVPIAEMRDKPDLKAGDLLIVLQSGSLFGREAKVVSSQRNTVTVQVSGVTMGLKLTDLALPPSNSDALDAVTSSLGLSQQANGGKKPSISKVDKLLQTEKNGLGGAASRSPTSSSSEEPSAGTRNVIMRTDSITVDVRGCNLEEAKAKAKDKFSSCLMIGRPVVYILHGHGTGGVLKAKIRQWLKTELQLVKKFEPADRTDGGDAFTRVELR